MSLLSYTKSFFVGLGFGLVEGAAEGAIGSSPKIKRIKKKRIAKNQTTGKIKPAKKPKISRKAKNRQAFFDEFASKNKRRGLRPGDKSRSPIEIQELFRSIPSDIRRDRELTLEFLNSREFGHLEPHSKSLNNDVGNMIWQDPKSNRILGNTSVDAELKKLLSQQNRNFARTGKDCPKLDKQIKQRARNLRKRKGKGKGKGKRKETSTEKPTKMKKNASDIGLAMVDKGVHVAAVVVGNKIGKVGGKVIGKTIAKTVGKKLAKKCGKKILKCIPIVGTVVCVGFGVATICANPANPWAYVSAVSDIGTSFLGAGGVALDIVVQTTIECVA